MSILSTNLLGNEREPSWQARKTNVEGGNGRVKVKTLSVTWKLLDEKFLDSHLATSTSPSTLSCNTVQILKVHISNQKQSSLSQHGDPKHQNLTRPNPCEAVPQDSGSSALPQPRITRVFQNPRHAGTMKQVRNGSSGGDSFGRARGVCCRGSEIIPPTHFPAETSCRILVRGRGCVTTYLGQILCRAHIHTIPNDWSPLPRSQIPRTRQAYTFQSCVCELLDL